MNRSTTQLLAFLLLIFSFDCKNDVPVEVVQSNPISKIEELKPIVKKVYPTFDRSSCIKRLADKIKNDEPLVIHLLVPLCDNDNQGIVKVSKTLGDGFNLRTNLYWGAKYGVKNYFHKLSPWKLVESQKDLSEKILERIIFYREYPNGTKAFLVADAYRGDHMKACMIDYFDAISGKSHETIMAKGHAISIRGDADLIAFNGHNGLMDYDIAFVENQDNKIRETTVIGCISHSYFVEHLKHAKAYPLLMTTNLMAPEAYVVDAVIDSWINQLTGPDIKNKTGRAYHKYQKCGVKGATRLFKSGW